MAAWYDRRSTSALLLLLALVIAIGVFGVPARYSSASALGLILAQLSLIGSSAWRHIALSLPLGALVERTSAASRLSGCC